MNKKHVCNYAVIRFLPYPETAEFVNIGVVINCSQAGYFDYRMENRRRERVTNFFPELDAQVFIEGRNAFKKELDRLGKLYSADAQTKQTNFPFNQELQNNAFKELVRPREVIFRFSEPSTVMTENPRQELQRLYKHYVERQFAQQPEYRERVMEKRLRTFFEENKIARFYSQKTLGDDIYKVKIPFVHEVSGRLDRAITPLNLGQKNTTQIIEHGTQWKNRIMRLQKMEKAPENMMFFVHKESRGKRYDAAMQICDELTSLDLAVAMEREEKQVLEFARVG